MLTTNFITKSTGMMGPLSPTISIPYCLYVTLPDSSADKLISNDGLCKSITFYPVGLSEVSNSEVPVRIYPVPTSGLIHFQSSDVVNSIEVFDFSGRLLLSKNVHTTTGTVDLSNRERGVYLIKLYDSEKLIAVKKLVRE
jgi:hypothetical protein